MEKYIGEVIHFFSRANVAVVKLEDILVLGDEIKIKRGNSEFTQNVDSVQIDHKNVDSAKRGEEVAVKIVDSKKTKEGDKVYKIA